MTVVRTHLLIEGEPIPHSQQIYNGLDAAITLEVFEEITHLHQSEPLFYSFQRALEAPALEMMLRGFKVDELARQKGIATTREKLSRLEAQLNTFAQAIWDKDLNPRSQKQLQAIFYDCMRLPEIWTSKKGERKLSMDREALEKLELYFHARPLISTILAIRDLGKQLDVLETEIFNGRMHTSYNIGGTETTRWSSSKSAFGDGGNLQNVAGDLRHILVADSGYKLVGIDLEQAESREVGWLCGTLFDDWSYLDACYCLDDSHEVLTPTGWQPISNKPNIIMTWKEGSMSFENIIRWNDCISDKLIEIDAPSLSIKGTPNHKMPTFAKTKDSQKIIKRTLAQIKASPAVNFPLRSSFSDGKRRVIEAALIAAFQADGTRDEAGKVHFSFVRPRKIEMMRGLLNELGYGYSEYSLGNGSTRFYIKMGQGQHDWPKECGKEILDWDLQSLKLFCESHKHWDGSFEGKACRIVAKNKEHLEWLATAYTLCGYHVAIHKHKKDYNILTIRTAETAGYRYASFTEESGQFRVYCPTTRAGFFLFRRNGKIGISGNSGDLHTLVCKHAWPDVKWLGTPKEDRSIADAIFYRSYSRRDLAKKLGHGCLTDDHEVLTRNGWVSIDSKPSEILIWEEGKSSFGKVSHWTDDDYSGPLISFEGNSISALMTPDHRVPYKADIRSTGIKVRPASAGPQNAMPLGADYEGGTEWVPARLIAAFMSDGHQKKQGQMQFHFHKERKIERIKYLCDIYCLSWRQRDDYILVDCPNLPKRPGAFMFNWRTDCLAEFLDEYKFWDGHQANTAQYIFSKYREDLEWIQTFGRILGIGGQIQKPQLSGFGTTMYKLQQNNRQWASGNSIKWVQTDIFHGKVYCPTVETGFFYVRRNSKIFVTGNSNYYGQPTTMARHAKITPRMAEQFQRGYFSLFPGIPKYHRWTAQQLQMNQCITNPWGLTRHFFGRANDDTTLREAIAFNPQSSTALRMNLILWRIWRHMPQVQLLGQVHDAVYFQFPENLNENDVISEALSHFSIPMSYKGHNLIVPGEASSGWNWGKFDEKSNPFGLKKFKAGVSDTRVLPSRLHAVQ